jgi:hypothetical protein
MANERMQRKKPTSPDNRFRFGPRKAPKARMMPITDMIAPILSCFNGSSGVSVMLHKMPNAPTHIDAVAYLEFCG